MVSRYLNALLKKDSDLFHTEFERSLYTFGSLACLATNDRLDADQVVMALVGVSLNKFYAFLIYFGITRIHGVLGTSLEFLLSGNKILSDGTCIISSNVIQSKLKGTSTKVHLGELAILEENW